MKILTCNLRFSSMPDHGKRSWSRRKDLCIETLRSESPDVICVQECHNDQLYSLDSAFRTGYDSFWMNSFPGNYYPENVIFFRRGFRLAGRGGFFLSETPHVPGSKSWESECVRFLNFVLLGAEGRLVRIANTHIDHHSGKARKEQTRMILEDSAAWPETIPQILTGDLNSDPSGEALHMLKDAGWRDSLNWSMETTFHGFVGNAWNGCDPAVCGCGRMDYILAKGKSRFLNSRIVKTEEDGIFPSDHWFVAAEVEFP